MNRLDDKVVLVSGGLGGIGVACVRAMHAQGAKVCAADVDSDGQANYTEQLGDLPGVFFQKLDVTSPESWQRAIDTVANAYGPLTTLINAAGILGRQTLEETSIDFYRQVVDVCQFGTFYGMKLALDSLKRSENASIVNFSSIAGIRGATVAFPYVAAKWAIRGMTEAAASELGPAGIRVNTVVPGSIRTAMTEGVTDDDMAHLPLARLAQPEEVAHLVVFLASDESSYITGADFVIDGGMTNLVPRPRSLQR